MFRARKDALGNVVRYIARLVANGFAQVHGVYFHEEFASVAKFTIIRCTFAIEALMDLGM